MLVKSSSRKEFLDLLQDPGGMMERYSLHSTDKLNTSYRNSDDVQLIWSEDDLHETDDRSRASGPRVPRVIVVERDKKRDFLAWVWTYVADFRPLTAYTRVLDAEEARPLLEMKRSPTLGPLEEACLGLILGEAATYVENTPERKPNITPLACASTYSYAMARALAVSAGGEIDVSDEGIAGAWSKARSLSRQRPLRLNAANLALPWKLLLNMRSNEDRYRHASRDVPDNVYTACVDLYKKSEVGPETWDLLARDHPRLREARREMQGPREGRVVFFEQFVLSLAENRRSDSEFTSFLCGFLASQIGPGTLDYLSLLTVCLDQFPTALLWYGFCSGLQHRSSLYAFSGGLGRRVLREILRRETLFDAPQSDIALAELEALTASDTAAMDFRTGTQGVLAIEIVPLVTTTVRWPPKQSDQSELFSTETSALELRDLNVLLDELRSRMAQVQKRISRFIDDRDSSDWKFGKGRKK
jgi:hypothetical protein